MAANQDPGWRAAVSWKLVFFSLFPAALTPRYGSIGTGPALVRVRMLWLSSILMMLHILWVTSFVVRGQEPLETPSWWWPLQLAYSALSIGLAFWARSRELDTTDDASLRKTYIATFMLGYALSLSPALIGFVGVFIIGGMTPLLVGLVFFAAGFAINAPTRASIARRQDELQRRGSTRSLIQVLE